MAKDAPNTLMGGFVSGRGPKGRPGKDSLIPRNNPEWHVYLVLCRDNTLYCGIAKSVVRRVTEHNAGAGARYIVPSRRPVACVWKRRVRGQGEALRLEYWLKRRTAGEKRALADGTFTLRRSRDKTWRLVRKPLTGTAGTTGN
jgi:putative endonuclease